MKKKIMSSNNWAGRLPECEFETEKQMEIKEWTKVLAVPPQNQAGDDKKNIYS